MSDKLNDIKEKYKKELERILKNEAAASYIEGKVEGALSIIAQLDFEKDKKIEILARGVGLSKQTATVYINELYDGTVPLD